MLDAGKALHQRTVIPVSLLRMETLSNPLSSGMLPGLNNGGCYNSKSYQTLWGLWELKGTNFALHRNVLSSG